MDEEYEWLSGDDEDDFYYWTITRCILFRLHQFDKKHKSHYFEDDDKKFENAIFHMVQFGRNENVIYNRLVCKEFSPWKIEELQSEVIFLYRENIASMIMTNC